jgi:hypothetical protein
MPSASDPPISLLDLSLGYLSKLVLSCSERRSSCTLLILPYFTPLNPSIYPRKLGIRSLCSASSSLRGFHITPWRACPSALFRLFVLEKFWKITLWGRRAPVLLIVAVVVGSTSWSISRRMALFCMAPRQFRPWARCGFLHCALFGVRMSVRNRELRCELLGKRPQY